MAKEEGEKAVEHIRRDRILNVPNVLTLVRILLLPVVVWRFLIGDTAGALIAYLAAMLTDALDGFIARKCHQVTALGKLLDPIADNLSLLTLLTLFVLDGQIPLWVLGVILVKELSLIVGGAVALRRGIVVYALPIGKVTTVAFIASIVARFLALRALADVLLGVSVLLSMVALVWYALDLTKKLHEQDKANNTLSTK